MPMLGALWWSYGGGAFLMSEVPLYADYGSARTAILSRRLLMINTRWVHLFDQFVPDNVQQ